MTSTKAELDPTVRLLAGEVLDPRCPLAGDGLLPVPTTGDGLLLTLAKALAAGEELRLVPEYWRGAGGCRLEPEGDCCWLGMPGLVSLLGGGGVAM